MDGLFAKLEDKKTFIGYVTAHFQNAPSVAIADFPCSHTVEPSRVEFAFGEYTQNVKQYSVLLDSKNPDHYKRSGGMLHALYNSKIIVAITYKPSKWGSIEELWSGTVLGLSYGDVQSMIRFPTFYEAFHNELLSFDLAYQLCAAYEPEPRGYDFGYLHNMCHYLRRNKDLTVDSLSMIFRSLMT